MILTLEQILKRTSDLPVVSAVAQRLLSEVEKPGCSAASVASQLHLDPSLSTKVLRLANSSYYGLTKQVSSIDQAVVILGIRSIRNLALAASSYHWLVRPLRGYNLGPQQLWTHSFGVAVLAKEVAKASRTCDPEVAFTAGLIHDLGMVVLSMWLDNKATALISYSQREKLGFDEVERLVLGFDHATVGAELGSAWGIPEEINQVLRWHHRPREADKASPLIDCVHLAAHLLVSSGKGVGEVGLRYAFDPDCLVRLGITAGQAKELADGHAAELSAYESIFGMAEAA